MVEKTILDSGLTIISEYIPTFPSFDLSYTLRGGSRMESRENNGVYHMIEHMLFKGSEKYNLKEIADLSDRLGGKLNAFTGKEITQYYIKAVDEYVGESFDLLTDMVMHSTFPEDEFEKEKNVALQEINESDDNPDTNAFETYYEKLFGKNPLGFPVGGKIKSVSALNRDIVFNFYKEHYTPENLVLASVGKLPHAELVNLAQNTFKNFPSKSPSKYTVIPAHIKHIDFSKKNASLSQVYVIIGFNCMPISSPDRHRFMILNDILGGGMSSRLFQKIREEKGLSYSISTFSDSYVDCGLHMAYSNVEPDKVNEYIEAVKTEILLLKKDGVSETELKRAKDSIKSSIILGFESRSTKMRFNVNNEIFLGREITIDEILHNITDTSTADLNRMFNEYLDLNNMSVFLYGNVNGKKKTAI